MTRSLLVGLLTLGVLLSVPITIVVGVLAVYFLVGGTNAFVLGVLGVVGLEEPTDSPTKLLWLGPVMAAVGALGVAALGGYFWGVAIMFRKGLDSRRSLRDAAQRH